MLEWKVGFKEDFRCCSHSETKTDFGVPALLKEESGERRRGEAGVGGRSLMQQVGCREKGTDLGA